MKRQMTFALAAVLLAAGSAVALEDQWGFGKITVDWYYADYTTADRTVTLYCVNKENQFIYGMPAKDLDAAYSELDVVDLVLKVDSRGEETTYDRTETAVATVEMSADMISFKVVGHRAWELQSVFAFSDNVTVGVSQRYIPENPEVDGKMVYLTRTGATETAVHHVLGPCVPEGYNDNPPSSEPEAPDEGETQSIKPN